MQYPVPMLPLLLLACAPKDAPDSAPIVVVTFNTGTTEGLPHEDGEAYTAEDAAISDQWYGDGLAWLPAVEAARAWFAAQKPDLVGFQEIFYAGECPEIPSEAHAGFYCELWSEGGPTVAEAILGEDYQIACNPGHPDKCAAVKLSFGSFRGCEGAFCLEGLDGGEVPGCGRGSRVGRGVVDRVDGGELTFVNLHGSSGLSSDDEGCRVAQIDQVFLDLGDGEPAANGDANLIVGDLNTDPGRWASFDDSAARWGELVGGASGFAWVTEVGPDAPLTYQGVATIDHVVSDAYAGDCWHAGVSEGHPAVFEASYFDHAPARCAVTPR